MEHTKNTGTRHDGVPVFVVAVGGPAGSDPLLRDRFGRGSTTMANKASTRTGKPGGRGLRAAGKNAPQLFTGGGGQWTEEAEATFLDRLAASCNVRMAAAAINYQPATLYWRRRRDPAFAERWHAALSQGYVRIEAMLIQSAEDALSGAMPDPGTPIPPMTVKEAMDLLRMHYAAVHGRAPRTPGRPARVRSIEEVRGSILAKLSAMEAADAGGAA